MKNYLQTIEKMKEAVKKGNGFDWVIVVSSNKEQAKFWQNRLQYLKGQVIGKNTKIFCQEEDWQDGAGQLLGTLYAFKKASQKIDLLKELGRGKKIAIYHTAGQGKRIAPLSFSEKGNKPAIKLPKLVKLNKKKVPATILETAIYSTQIFASTREGRLCVFWGDQIFIPSKEINFGEDSPVEIFSIWQKSPTTKKEWQKNWQSYGVLIPAKIRGVLQREKIPWQEFLKFKTNLVGKSVGSFSISSVLFKELLEEFKIELNKKVGRLETDFHLWMPLTSSKKDYLKRGGGSAHFTRIERLKRFLERENPNSILIKETDLGEKTFWWDFGQLSLYQKNLIKTLSQNLEGKILRKFFELDRFFIKTKSQKNTEIKNSIVIDSQVKGKIENSLVFGVKSENLRIKNALVINSRTQDFFGQDALLYNLLESERVVLEKEEVLTEIPLNSSLKEKSVRIKTKLNRDGKKDWQKRIFKNPYSYQELEKLI